MEPKLEKTFEIDLDFARVDYEKAKKNNREKGEGGVALSGCLDCILNQYPDKEIGSNQACIDSGCRNYEICKPYLRAYRVK